MCWALFWPPWWKTKTKIKTKQIKNHQAEIQEPLGLVVLTRVPSRPCSQMSAGATVIWRVFGLAGWGRLLARSLAGAMDHRALCVEGRPPKQGALKIIWFFFTWPLAAPEQPSPQSQVEAMWLFLAQLQKWHGDNDGIGWTSHRPTHSQGEEAETPHWTGGVSDNMQPF